MAPNDKTIANIIPINGSLKKYNNRLGGIIVAFDMEIWQTWEIDSIEEVD